MAVWVQPDHEVPKAPTVPSHHSCLRLKCLGASPTTHRDTAWIMVVRPAHDRREST